MSKEKTEGQKLAEQLLYTRPHAAEASEELNKAADEFCEGYKAFLDNGKTERDVTTYTVKLLEEDRKSTRLNSSHTMQSRMPSSA